MQSGFYRDMSVPRPGKNVVLAYFLWFFLGFLGAHRYYLGHILKGLLFLVGSLAAVAISAFDGTAVRVIAAVLGLALLVFWIIDAIKLPKLARASGVDAPAASHE